MAPSFLILLLLHSLHAFASSQRVNQTDSLLKWKASLHYKSQTSLFSWVGNNPCSWDGITCDKVGSITNLNLSSYGLKVDCCSSRRTEAVDSTQPLQRPNPFDPQRRVQEVDPTTVVLETPASDATTQPESPSDEEIDVATPQQRHGRGQAKPVQMPTDGTKIPLELDEFGGLPQKVRRQIVIQMRENLPAAYTSWGQVLAEHRDMFWNIFCQTYEWDPAIHKSVCDLWHMTARIKFKNALSQLKTKCARRNFEVKPPDMNPELWASLVHLWTKDEGHLRRSNSAKENRAKGPRVTHTSGSMDVNAYRKKMQQANTEGRPPTFPELYTSRRQHKGKGKDQLPVYCNDEAREIGEKLVAEYAARQEEEDFDPTIAHGELLVRATGGVKKGWLKGLDIHTHPQDIGVSTSRREPFRPPIIGQSSRVQELEQTVQSLKTDNDSLRESQRMLIADNESLRQSQLTLTAQMQQIYQHLGVTPVDTSGTITPSTPRDM